jgi:hypothetical protein
MTNQQSEFIQSIKDSVPTHVGQDFQEMMKNVDYVTISSVAWPKALVIQMAIAYCTKYASYSTNDQVAKGELLFANMPIIISSTSEEAKDRTLIWANGFIGLSSAEHIVLSIDKKLLEHIDKNE